MASRRLVKTGFTLRQTLVTEVEVLIWNESTPAQCFAPAPHKMRIR